MAYLVDNPPARSQYRSPRRQTPSGVIVVHTAENTPDTVTPDGGAEAVARFIRSRDTPGSYHDLCDSDTIINLVPYNCEAYQDGTGSNPHALSVSGATRAAMWLSLPVAYRNAMTVNMARAAARQAVWLRTTHGVVVPARRINRDQSTAGVPGFISHAERDPDRRSDPGAAFDWFLFLDTFDQLASQEDDDVTPDELQQALRVVLNEGTAEGFQGWANTNRGDISYGRQAVTKLDALASRLTAVEAKLADLVGRPEPGTLTVEGEFHSVEPGAEG